VTHLTIIQYYIQLLRATSLPGSQELLAGRAGSQFSSLTRNPFGSFRVDYPAGHKSTLTLRDAAFAEWSTIETVLRKVLYSDKDFCTLKNTPPCAFTASSGANNSKLVSAAKVMPVSKQLPGPALSTSASTTHAASPSKPITGTKDSCAATKLLRRHNEAQADAGAISGMTSTTSADDNQPFVFHGLGAKLNSPVANKDGSAPPQALFGNNGMSKNKPATDKQQTLLNPTAIDFPTVQTPMKQLNPAASTFAITPGNVSDRRSSWIDTARGGPKKARK